MMSALLWATLLFLSPVEVRKQDRYPRPPVLSRDHVESLVLLGRVWGFVKYHHRRFASEGEGADKALRAEIAGVLQAASAGAERDSIRAWLDGLAYPPSRRSDVDRAVSAALPAELHWITDTAVVGSAIAVRLGRIYTSRQDMQRQYYVGSEGPAHNSKFYHEPSYSRSELSDPALRALAVFRLWNILEYWFPYRDLMERDRTTILRDALKDAWEARNFDDYRRALLRLLARARDTHATIVGAWEVQPPVGAYALPVTVRMIEGKVVVSGYAGPAGGSVAELRVGDVVLAIDGVSVDSLFKAWAPLYPASNEARRRHNMAQGLLRGINSPATVLIDRDGRRGFLRVQRLPLDQVDRMTGLVHDSPGPTFRMLGGATAYLKLSTVSVDSVAYYFAVARVHEAKAIILDLRGYPRGFPVYAIASQLVMMPTPFAKITRADWAKPGAFVWDTTLSVEPIAPASPKRAIFGPGPAFGGKVIILVDELTWSSGEFHAMAFRAVPGAVVVGSTTAGADGNVSSIPLPGGVVGAMSGIGVFYPDGRPTQQVGIIPDVFVRPTLRGFRAGRDEVLEAGLQQGAWLGYR